MSPPLPPSPPSGPPNSMNFSRRKLTAPGPPAPERTKILAWSRKCIARGSYAMPAVRETLDAADADLGAVDIAKAGDAGAVHVGRWAGENDSVRLGRGIEIIDVGCAEAKLHGSGGIFIRRGVEGELRVPSVELAPERRLEGEAKPQSVAVESDCGVHVADEFDRIIEAHFDPPLAEQARRHQHWPVPSPLHRVCCALSTVSRLSRRCSAHCARVMQTRFVSRRVPICSTFSQTICVGSPAALATAAFAGWAMPGSR